MSAMSANPPPPYFNNPGLSRNNPGLFGNKAGLSVRTNKKMTFSQKNFAVSPEMRNFASSVNKLTT